MRPTPDRGEKEDVLIIFSFVPNTGVLGYSKTWIERAFAPIPREGIYF